MSARAILLLTVACTGVSRSAHADDWYGSQTLGSDAASYLLLGIGVPLENPYLGFPGAALWLLGPPTIHLSHGEKGRAGISLGGRLLLLVVGALFVGRLSSDGGTCNDQLCSQLGEGGVKVGFVLGMIAASVLDAVIAREDDDSSDAVMLTIGGGF